MSTLNERDQRLWANLNATLGDDELAQLRAEAKAAAMAEVRAQLKEAYVAQILARLSEPQVLADSPVVEPAVAEPEYAEPECAEPSAVVAAPIASERLFWVYGVRRCGPSLAAAPGVAAGEPLFAVARGGLEAVVSAVPADAFGEGAIEANLGDAAWLEQVARAHHEVQMALLAQGAALVPLRLATLFASVERVAELLAERADEFYAALERLDGRGEWGVKLYLDEATLRQRLDAVSPKVAELRAQIAGRPAGAVYLLQKQLDRLLADETARLGDGCAEHVHARLAALSAAAERGAVRESDGLTMLLNGAYLLDDDARERFDLELAALRDEYEPLGFRLVSSGPWPPYHFVERRSSAVAEHA